MADTIVISSVVQEGEEALLVDAKLPFEDADGKVELRDHLVLVPVAALGSRMAAYELDDAERALQAIMREHYNRLHPALETAITREQLQEAAVDESVGIDFSSEAQEQLRDLLAAHGEAISSAYEVRAG